MSANENCQYNSKGKSFSLGLNIKTDYRLRNVIIGNQNPLLWLLWSHFTWLRRDHGLCVEQRQLASETSTGDNCQLGVSRHVGMWDYAFHCCNLCTHLTGRKRGQSGTQCIKHVNWVKITVRHSCSCRLYATDVSTLRNRQAPVDANPIWLLQHYQPCCPVFSTCALLLNCGSWLGQWRRHDLHQSVSSTAHVTEQYFLVPVMPDRPEFDHRV